MAETLGELWREWASGSVRVLLAIALIMLIGTWATAAVFTFRQARRSWRSPAGVTLVVILTPLAVAMLGIVQPSAFVWWALLGLALAPALAALDNAVLRRSTAQCSSSHSVAPGWAFCPACPSPMSGTGTGAAAAVRAGFVGRGVATLLRRPPSSAPADPQPVRPINVEPDPADVLVRLAHDINGAPDVVIRRPGATVGRNPVAEVCIDDSSVSWEHAQILSRDGAPAIVDLGSSNGTYVNGERIDESLLLHHDQLQFGDVVFRVVRA